MKIKEGINYMLELIWGDKPKPKRARNSNGRFVGDDFSSYFLSLLSVKTKHGLVVKPPRKGDK